MGLKDKKAALVELKRNLRLVAFVFLIEVQALNILFPISLILFGIGVIPVNIVLAAVSCFLLIFTIVRYVQESRVLQSIKKTVDRVCRIIKILAKAVSLGISIYGIVIIINDVNWFSVFVVVLSIFSWFVQVIVELIREIVEIQLEKISQAVRNKTNQVKENVTNLAKCIKGEEGADKSRATPAQQKAISLFEKGKATFNGVKNTLTGKEKKPTDENK